MQTSTYSVFVAITTPFGQAASMEKRARDKGYRGNVALVGTALSALIFAHGTYAQDAVNSAYFTSSYDSSMTANEAALATNFNDRWGDSSSSTKEFVLGSNGVVSKETAAKPAVKPQETVSAPVSNIGAGMNAYFHVTEGAQASLPARPSGALPTFSGPPPKIGGSSVVSECGRSPMEPDAIKALVAETARRHNVDETFAVAIAWAESRFDEVRNSPKGARGPMQLIPETAARFGVRDICDPAQNIEGGIKYLRFLIDEFQNPLLVAAAYNSGEGRIYEYGGVPPFQETVGYVAKVVNFQLGLPMPSGKRKAGNVVSDVATKMDGNAGVIAVEKSGKFVGGVMHF
jgi:hypothetical protein